MNGRRAVVGLCMLCALLVSAFAAQSASAAGTTAYTCVKGGSGTTYNTPHCRPGDPAGEYSHKSIEKNTTTELTGNSKDHAGNPIQGSLVSTVFGTTIELKGEVIEGSGTMENKEEGSEMWAEGSGTITFREVTVAKPASCEVTTDVLPEKTKGEVGVIHTESLKATTKGQGDRLKFEPSVGTVFARFWIDGPPSCPLDQTFTVTGTVQGVPNGATTVFTEEDTTTQNTLKVNGAKAGLSGSLTIEGKDPEIGADTYKPLSVTT